MAWDFLHKNRIQLSSQNTLMDRGGALEVPTHYEELLVIDGYWGRRVSLLQGYGSEKLLILGRWSYTHAHTGITKWIQWVLKNRKNT